VTLDELATEVKGAMNALEQQRHGYATHGFPGGFKLAVAKAPTRVTLGQYKSGSFVLAPDGYRMRAGRVVAGTDGKAAVRFYDYTLKRLTTPAADKLKDLPQDWASLKGKSILIAADGKVTVEKPAEIEVEWNGEWFPASILKKDGDKTHIHYVGFESSWDEWVPKNRIRALKK
jgi:hypothetical protein